MSGIKMQLLYEEKKKAYMYVLVSGFYKVRLAQFLSISRPTLDRMLHDDPHFFTQLQAADAEFCKKLIMQVAKKKIQHLSLKQNIEPNFLITVPFQ